jgi:hypothetical protein
LRIHPGKKPYLAAAGLRTVWVSQNGGKQWRRVFRVQRRSSAEAGGVDADRTSGHNTGSGADSDADPDADSGRGNRQIRDVCWGYTRLFIATRRALWVGRLGRGFHRAFGLPRNKKISAVVYRPRKRAALGGDVLVVLGREIWIQRDSNRPFRRLAVLPAKLHRLAVGPGRSPRIAVAGKTAVYLSHDRGRHFRLLPLLGRVRDVGFVRSRKNTIDLVLVGRDGVRVYVKKQSNWQLRFARRLPGGAVAVARDRRGQTEALWIRGARLWAAWGDWHHFRSMDLGLAGKKRRVAGAVSAPRRSGPANAWAATEAGIYRLYWARIAPVRGPVRRPVALRPRRRRMATRLQAHLRAAVDRARRARFVPQMTVQARWQRSTWRRISTTSTKRFYGVMVTFSWPFLSAVRPVEMAVDRQHKLFLRQQRVRRFDRLRAYHTYQRLKRFAAAVSGLSLLQKASLRLEVELARALYRCAGW